jgi:hypothetical protein
MTEPTPTPEKQDLPAVPDPERTSQNPPEPTGFFDRVRQNLNPEKTKHMKGQEIVVMDDEGNDGT